jgi:hypothetical protein
MMLQDYSFAVDDESLLVASQILETLGLPFSPSLSWTYDYSINAIEHRVTASQSPETMQCIALYPASFNGLSLDESAEEPSYLRTSSPPRCATIRVPPPPAVYASLMRAMARYRPRSFIWNTLASDFEQLVDYHLLGECDGYLDPADDAVRDSPEMLERQARAIATVKGWNCAHAWRAGEEWMGDVLIAILQGEGGIAFLPTHPVAVDQSEFLNTTMHFEI